MDNKLNIGINRNIKNKNDLMQRYKQAFDRISHFQPFMIDDKTLAKYYKFCVEQDLDVDEFMRLFNIDEEKTFFVTRANKAIEESKKTYFQSLENNTELTLWFDYDAYTKNTINDICSYTSVIKEKGNKLLNFKFFIPEKGLRKPDLQNLLDLSEILGQDLAVVERGEASAEVPLSKVIKAYGEMDDFVDNINSRNLSPFEKFLLVHDYAANRIYKDAEPDPLFWNPEKSRSFVNVMTSDTIVCAGYAHIVKEFCKRLGIDCEYISGEPLSNINEQGFYERREFGHAANIVHIVDEKYGIDGYYFCDACWDSKENSEQINRNYLYAALPIQDIDNIGQSKYFTHEVSRMNIPKYSKPISVDIFRKALNKIYKNEEQVDDDLQKTIRLAYKRCLIKSDNDFMQEYFRQREHGLI